ncbi:putative nitronate monooxygenase [Yarrowia sp. C11]|nr:putative nitronate monooxygenase [Yarrowia sp. E02]KAG5372932.1 putative nitronate monooxygenase [Yarrowia sp. C11]
MAGATTPSFVAKSNNLGFVGNLGCGYMMPSKISEGICEIKKSTNEPFGINLFVSGGCPDYDVSISSDPGVLGTIESVYATADISFKAPSYPSCVPPFGEQLAAVLANPPPIVSFTFGIISSDQVEQLHAKNIVVIGTATNREEAVQWKSVGADAVVLQGREAGGHRGTWIGAEKDSLFTLDELIEATRDVDIPVIPAGGVVSVERVRSLQKNPRVVSVTVGTAFLLSHESPLCDAHKQHLVDLSDVSQVANTFAFSGKMAKGAKNGVFETLKEKYYSYPIQHYLTSGLRAEAAKQGKTEYLAMWCGDGVVQRNELKSLDELAKEFGVSKW